MAASNSVPADAANLAILRRLLNEPEGQVDLSRAKVTIDHMVDPKVDVEGTLGLLDQWAAKIRARFPPGASNKAKINLLVSTLYESGPWNDHRPFGYDFSDPYGRDPNNTLLSIYLARRKGQCVIMPIAIVLLGQKLGLPVTMTTAPYHLIVKYGDEEIGQWTNLEATSGRFYADSGYEQALRIPSEAIKNDTFMRPYTQKESVALFATASLAPLYKERRQPESLLQLTNLLLKANPKDVIAITLRADAYYLLVEQRLLSKYPSVDQMPPAALEELKSLSGQNRELYSKAEALGWKAWTKADWDRYLDHFANQKSKLQRDE